MAALRPSPSPARAAEVPSGALNRLLVDGEVARTGEARYTPAGIPIVRFVLEHASRQVEAGVARVAECRLAVVACGPRLADQARALEAGQRLRVQGFISRADHHGGQGRVVLHAESIELIESTTDTAPVSGD